MATNTPKNINAGMTNPDISSNVERDRKNPDRNPDPITGTPGSHPVGTGIGAAAAGAAGAAIGSVVPGLGTTLGGAIGAAVGAVAGGLAGKGVAEVIDPTTENTYWRNEYRNRKYFDSSLDYDADFAPAYRYGWESYNAYADRPADEVEDRLRAGWEKNRGTSRLEWDRAQHAVRDAWDRVKDRAGNMARDNPGNAAGSTHRTNPDVSHPARDID